MKLKLATDRRSKGIKDERGTIVVKVSLCDYGHKPRKGNITRTIRFENAKVSEVLEAIQALGEA